MASRKCKACGGKGFVFITVPDIESLNLFIIIRFVPGEKAQCSKCFGKGVK
ncbi:hypothetical protein [Bacillus cereus]|uniref:hypothetical protein n=1 Tax=Bacillus cereus TaxID=1396 RepID=UPI003F534C33